MKFYDFLLIVGFIFLMTILSWLNEDTHHEEQKELIEQRFNQLDSAMQHRSKLDSLYWNHLENCAFIQKDSIDVGYNGYLYDKYHRK